MFWKWLATCYACMHGCTHTYTGTQTHAHTHTDSQTHTHTYIHTHTHTYVHTYPHTHIRTYMYTTYAHMHKFARTHTGSLTSVRLGTRFLHLMNNICQSQPVRRENARVSVHTEPAQTETQTHMGRIILQWSLSELRTPLYTGQPAGSQWCPL